MPKQPGMSSVGRFGAAPPAAGQSAAPAQTVTASAEMIARWMRLPNGAEVAGRELSLFEALSLVGDPRRQLEVVHAYWRLAAAVAEYHVCHGQVDALAALRVRPEDEARLQTARAAAAASRDEAEVALIRAQHELAEQAMLPTTLPLPLPADRPHVGQYRTYFTEIFAGRLAPVLGQRIDRTLPIRRRSIDHRAEAVRAAEAACASAEESYRAGRADLEAVLSSMTDLSQQRWLLIGSVCEYNDEIADYVISVVARPADAAALVTMLIKPSRPIAQAMTPGTTWAKAATRTDRPWLLRTECGRPPTTNPPSRPANPRCCPWSSRRSRRRRAESPLVGMRAPPIAPREPPRLDSTREPPNLAPIQGLGEPAGAAPPSGAVEPEAPSSWSSPSSLQRIRAGATDGLLGRELYRLGFGPLVASRTREPFSLGRHDSSAAR